MNRDAVRISEQMHRRFLDLLAAAFGARGLGIYGDDLVVTVDQTLQRRHCKLRCPHKDDPQTHDQRIS